MEYRSIIEESELFDEFFYMASYREARVSDELPLDHFIKYGLKEDRKPNEWFDPVWYREYYEDIKETRVIPFVHYLTEGLKEFRFANENEKKEYELLQDSFNPVAYRDSYEDLQKMEDDFDFLGHYVCVGKGEGRIFFNGTELSDVPSEIKLDNSTIDNFDENAYLQANPDISEAIELKQFKDAKHHLEFFGLNEIKEGKRKFHIDHAIFDQNIYLLLNPDVIRLIELGEVSSIFEHFKHIGYKEILEGKKKMGITPLATYFKYYEKS